MKSYWLAGSVTMLGMAIIMTTASSAAAVTCGDVLTGPGTFRLEQDLVCSTTPALTVRDGATLDLRGHTVRCAELDNGIALAGTAARLLNGTVTGCNDGVALTGSRHLVKRVRSTFNVRGFVAEDGLMGARLDRSSAEYNGAGGFLITGDDNVLTRNAAFGNGDVAVFVIGDGNTLSRNATNGNCIIGGCTAAYVIAGDGNDVTRNGATGEDTGFLVMSGYGGATANSLTRNKALFSFLAGIVVQVGASGNTLERNTASGAGVHLVDFNEDCDGNVWRRNVFETANQACIR
jgi:parallel beta-helix repeat protein